MADNSSKTKLSFCQKLARVYGRGSDESVPVNPSIEVDRGFTKKFSDQEREALETEQRRVGERLATGISR